MDIYIVPLELHTRQATVAPTPGCSEACATDPGLAFAEECLLTMLEQMARCVENRISSLAGGTRESPFPDVTVDIKAERQRDIFLFHPLHCVLSDGDLQNDHEKHLAP